MELKCFFENQILSNCEIANKKRKVLENEDKKNWGINQCQKIELAPVVKEWKRIKNFSVKDLWLYGEPKKWAKPIVGVVRFFIKNKSELWQIIGAVSFSVILFLFMIIVIGAF